MYLETQLPYTSLRNVVVVGHHSLLLPHDGQDYSRCNGNVFRLAA